MANIIDMPKLSDTMAFGTVVKWLKREGESVRNGDMIAEVETDKATMELECFFDGALLKIFVPAGSQAPIGAPLCAVGSPGERVAAPSPPESKAVAVPAPEAKPAPPSPEPTAPKAAKGSAPTISAAGVAQAADRARISPLARKLATEKGIDPARATGSGPGGRIVRADILAAERAALDRPGASLAGRMPEKSGPIQEDKVMPASNMRAAIARRTAESKSQAPHIYLEIEVDAAPLLALRAQLNAALEADGVNLSVNDFILKAAARALRRVPIVNCSWEAGGVRQHPVAHVAFAVAIDDGLITPVVRDTEAKTLFAISSEAKALARLAKERKLQPAQYTGGTFCVSNLGMMGIERFCAIINLPNAAILAVGAAVRKPVVAEDRIAIGERMALTLSCDHRVVDGAAGARYLNALKEVLEKPALLLI
jgi:pyruvate dehydrogenase E2 component (dihydrolipoamide acetyltransferase)